MPRTFVPRAGIPLVLTAALAVCGCGWKPADATQPTGPAPTTAPSTTQPNPSTPSPAPAPVAADTKPVATLTAKELHEESKKDPNVLITKYAGKVVDVTGVVDDVVRGSVFLKADDKGIATVTCPSDVDDQKKAALVGKNVRLRARIPTSALDPVPLQWSLVETK